MVIKTEDDDLSQSKIERERGESYRNYQSDQFEAIIEARWDATCLDCNNRKRGIGKSGGGEGGGGGETLVPGLYEVVWESSRLSHTVPDMIITIGSVDWLSREWQLVRREGREGRFLLSMSIKNVMFDEVRLLRISAWIREKSIVQSLNYFLPTKRGWMQNLRMMKMELNKTHSFFADSSDQPFDHPSTFVRTLLLQDSQLNSNRPRVVWILDDGSSGHRKNEVDGESPIMIIVVRKTFCDGDLLRWTIHPPSFRPPLVEERRPWWTTWCEGQPTFLPSPVLGDQGHQLFQDRTQREPWRQLFPWARPLQLSIQVLFTLWKLSHRVSCLYCRGGLIKP